MISLYIANLAAYNRGHLVGERITLPMSHEELEGVLSDILNGEEAITSRDFVDEFDEEYAIHDYESDIPLKIGEYTNVIQLNDQLQELEALTDGDLIKVKAILDGGLEDDIMKIINELDQYNLNEGIHTEYELGAYSLDGEDLPLFVQQYIDYAAYGRDICMSGTGEFTDYGFIERLD